MRYLLTFAALTVGSAYAANPQSTLKLPTSTLDVCPCPSGGPCTCQGACNCPGCSCAACPAKRPDGVAIDYADALQAARKHNCGLVAFVGLPARPVSGAVSYYLEAKANPTPRIRAGTVDVGRWLGADATDSEIMVACHPGRPVVGHQKVCDDAGCKLLPIFGEVTYTNAALAAPPMYSFGSFGCSGGG
jgi:hypothetical protein